MVGTHRNNKWAQLYGGFLEGEYNWFDEKPGYFPLFTSLFKTSPDLADVGYKLMKLEDFLDGL